MGSLAIGEVVHHATHFPHYPTMLDTEPHRSERSPYENAYRSSSASSSHRNSSQPRSTPIPTPSRSQTSATSDLPTPTSSRAIPRRESVSQASTQRSETQQPEPPSPRLAPSQDAPAAASTPATTTASQSENHSPAHESPQSSASHPTPNGSAPSSPVRIQVKNLEHIHSFLRDETNPLSLRRSSSQTSGSDDRGQQYEISGMPITDVIEMVAGLLTKITTTNDRQHEHLHRHIPSSDGVANLSQQTASVLAFHGKNVPSITILSYLTRIHKYCPTTYEVFISLLVYFDRMTEKVNAGLMQGLRDSEERSGADARRGHESPLSSGPDGIDNHDLTNTPPSSLPRELENGAARQQRPVPRAREGTTGSIRAPLSPPLHDSDPYALTHFFVADSFNIHRLVIAAVTCASKYFSDVFYTNSRYAKVGGLPLVELNHLEMQFLLLNDFRLAVPVEELESYATMLVEFYAREVAAQKHNGMEGVEAPAS